jgi:3-hydroxybutyryl-CoA dehydrogenase
MTTEPSIQNVSIVGFGTQGPRIAFRCAVAGLLVSAYDILPAKRDEGMQSICGWLELRVSDGRLSRAQSVAALDRLRICSTLADCVREADLVIEVVPEQLDLKQKVWAEIDRLAPEKTLLTADTSSLKSSVLGRDVRRKDRTFTLNFGFPVEDDAVELMWNDHTSEPTKDAARRFLVSMGMIYAETRKEITGFSFNRTWRAVKKECLRLVDQGYVDLQDLDREFILELGTRYGPFQRMDKIGLDVVLQIEETYYRDSGDPSDKPPKLLTDLVAAGHLGVKSGRGFYGYPNPEYEEPGWLRKKMVQP